jgi:murein DD-endopeptidase MepM/ murein hydrolase activator NlpD
MNPKKKKKLLIPGNITTPYGGQTRGENFHPGIDIANKAGTPISALEDGVITKTGQTSNGMGNVVELKDVNGDTHQYSHLQGFNVKPGVKVRKGQTIARMGSTGNSYSPSGGDPSHLDIRIVSAYGRFKNPLTYLRNFK